MNHLDDVVIAVDIGGSNIRAALVDQTGKIMHREVTPNSFADGSAKVIQRITEVVDKTLLVADKLGTSVSGIGVAAAGQVDASTGVIVGSCVLDSEWIGVRLTELIEGKYHLPTKVDNDGNVAALGEFFYGGGQGFDNVICLVIGTGVGGGVILDGQVYRGSKGIAAEFGHMCVDFSGPECHCGSRGCLELYSSGTGIARLGKNALVDNNHCLLHQRAEANEGKVTSELVFESARGGDAVGREVLHVAGRALSTAIVSLIHMFNPELVLINGGISQQGQFLLDLVENDVQRCTMPAFRVPVRLGDLGPDANLLGAAVLIWNHISDPGSVWRGV